MLFLCLIDGANVPFCTLLTIGHYDLRNGYLDKRGNLHIKMYDTYDFNKDNHTILNQAGRNQMIKGTLKPSFSIHDIIVPNYVINELWK